MAVVEALPPGDTGPLIRAQAARFRALVAVAEGDAQRAEASFKTAAAAFREYGTPFWLACTQLEQAEWLVSAGRSVEAEPLVADARETFERLPGRRRGSSALMRSQRASPSPRAF